MIVQLEEVLGNPKPAVEFMNDLDRKDASFEDIMAGADRFTKKGNEKFDKKHYRDAADRY